MIWSTVVGDPPERPDRAARSSTRSRPKYEPSPGFSNAGDQYDLVKLWAQAAGYAGDPYAFDKINAYIKARPTAACAAAYTFDRPRLTCIAYPDDTADPSIGMPHLTFQIQDGKQVSISPDPYTTGKFQLPRGWLDGAPAGSGGRSLEARADHQALRRAARGRRRVLLVGAGEVLGIAGPNGAGKTTLFDTITGHTDRDRRRDRAAGEPIRGTKIHHRCRLGLARTFQHPVAADTLTVLENAYLAAQLPPRAQGRRSRSDDVAAGRAALELVGLEGSARGAGRARCRCTTASG